MLMLLKLSLIFAKIGILTLGGGMVMLPLVQREMVAHDWMTPMEFLEILGVSEATPGPLSVNCATFVGWRVAGLPGSITATLSLVLPSLICVLLFGVVWRRFCSHPGMARVLSVLRVVIAGLILAVALDLCYAVIGASVDSDSLSDVWRPVLVAGVVCAGVLHGKVSPILLLLGGASVGALIY